MYYTVRTRISIRLAKLVSKQLLQQEEYQTRCCNYPSPDPSRAFKRKPWVLQEFEVPLSRQYAVVAGMLFPYLMLNGTNVTLVHAHTAHASLQGPSKFTCHSHAILLH